MRAKLYGSHASDRSHCPSLHAWSGTHRDVGVAAAKRPTLPYTPTHALSKNAGGSPCRDLNTKITTCVDQMVVITYVYMGGVNNVSNWGVCEDPEEV